MEKKNKDINRKIIEKLNKEKDFLHYFRNKTNTLFTVIYFCLMIILITIEPLKTYTFELLFSLGKLFFRNITKENIEWFATFVSCIFMVLVFIIFEIIFYIISNIIKRIGRKNGVYKF
jgi:hypothetical protein